VRRLGWVNGLALVLLLLACAGFFGALPELRRQEAQNRATLEQARKTLAQPQVDVAPPLSNAERNLQAFHDLLGESRYAEQQVKTLFAIAAKNNLTLSQAEYKLGNSKSGTFSTYTISLPVHGQYGAIRTFCQQVLLAIPFASLDQVEFKRDAVGNTNLEGKLRFTLYLDGQHGTGIADNRTGIQ
jgi:hypothetical protein